MIPRPSRKRLLFPLLGLLTFLLASCGPAVQESDQAAFIRTHYEKTEAMIPMRDGIRLYTAIYAPKPDSPVFDHKGGFPFLMIRTPYSSGPYGEDAYPAGLGPDERYVREGYIFVSQDVRGQFLSEGEFINMTPHIEEKQDSTDVDESTDTYDTVAWLVENVPDNNGKVGQWGISYPGFYTAAGMIDAHPALVAVSPQAPIADWWYDDFHHHGAFFLPHAFGFLSFFGLSHEGQGTEWPGRIVDIWTPDGYLFYMDMGPLKNANERYLEGRIAFWNDIVEHPNYDRFWQRRNIIPHLDGVTPAVLTVGGWYDAEDLYGPLNIYRAVEANNPDIFNVLVKGPWAHGGWHRSAGDQLGDAYFEEQTSRFFLEQVEFPFFQHYLKGAPAPELAEATMFETGSNTWRTFDQWPPAEAASRSLFMRDGGSLSWSRPSADRGYDAYISDPAKPVPHTREITQGMNRTYMTEDQRFAARRPDVLVYRSEVLEEPVTLAGPIVADLWVSTSQQDADWVVKVIDEFPPDAEDFPDLDPGMHTGGYQMMVRSEVLRGRFREDPSRPEPFTPGEPSRVRVPLQDVLHTFRPGHRIMIQIQSTWFPLVDRNPQKWVDNIYQAEAGDFTAAEHRVYRMRTYPSRIQVGVLPPER
ncbi:MAG: CocE/NonD family hydrolase [bacterium]